MSVPQVPEVPGVHTGSAIADEAVNAIVVEPVNKVLVGGLNGAFRVAGEAYAEVKSAADRLDGIVHEVADDWDKVGRLIEQIVSGNILGYVADILKDALGISVDVAVAIVAVCTVIIALGWLGGVASVIALFL